MRLGRGCARADADFSSAARAHLGGQLWIEDPIERRRNLNCVLSEERFGAVVAELKLAHRLLSETKCTVAQLMPAPRRKRPKDVKPEPKSWTDAPGAAPVLTPVTAAAQASAESLLRPRKKEPSPPKRWSETSLLLATQRPPPPPSSLRDARSPVLRPADDKHARAGAAADEWRGEWRGRREWQASRWSGPREQRAVST